MNRHLVTSTAIVLAANAGAAHAQSTHLVPEDFPTVEAAIAAAVSGDTISATTDSIGEVRFTDFLGKALNLQSRGTFFADQESLFILPDGSGWLTETPDRIELQGAVQIEQNAGVFFFAEELELCDEGDIRLATGATLDIFGTQQIAFNGDTVLAPAATLNIASTKDDDNTNALTLRGILHLQDGASLNHDAGMNIDNDALLLAQNASVVCGSLDIGDASVSMAAGSLVVNGNLQTISGSSAEQLALLGTDLTVTGQNAMFRAATITDARISLPVTDFEGRADLAGSDTVAAQVFVQNSAELILTDTSFSSSNLDNNGVVRGSGIWSTGDQFDNGNLTVIEGDTTHFGDFSNQGVLAVLEGTLTLLGDFNNNGTIIGDIDLVPDDEGGAAPATDPGRALIILPENPSAPVQIRPGQRLDFPNGDIIVRGRLLVQAESDDVNLASTSVRIVPTGEIIGEFSTPAADLGPVLQGLRRDLPMTYPVAELRIAAGAPRVHVTGEANYVDHLVIEEGAQLVVVGGNLYYNSIDNQGVITNPQQAIQINACALADIQAPYGTLNFNDVVAYLNAFAEESPLADFAAPIGTINFNDVVAFLAEFAAGCP